MVRLKLEAMKHSVLKMRVFVNVNTSNLAQQRPRR